MTPTNLTELIQLFTDFAILTVPVLVALALLFFVWGLATFILNSGNKDEGKKGRDRMVWGLVALFVILSIGGMLSAVQNTIFGGVGGLRGGTGAYGDHANSTLPQPSAFEGGGNAGVLSGGGQDRGFRYCFLGVGNNCERTWRDRWLRN